MTCKRQLSLLPIFVALLFAADEAWKGKQIAEWSEDDVRQVLTDSPWAKTVKPTVDRSAHSSQGRSGGLGRGGGIGIGGIVSACPAWAAGGAAEWAARAPVEAIRVADGAGRHRNGL